MRKLFVIFFLFYFCNLDGDDRNLAIFIDTMHQETVKSEDINMTHQCITALQQRASLVMVSRGLWKNIIERKKRFEKKLEDTQSLESEMMRLYTRTNQELKAVHYHLTTINQKLQQSWFAQNFPVIAALSAEDFNQVRFNFLCYMFNFDTTQWRVYNAHTGMLLFVPKESNYHADEQYQVSNEEELYKQSNQKLHLIATFEKLFNSTKDRWVIYMSGHGHPKNGPQSAHIAGVSIEDFRSLLLFFNEQMQIQVLVYSTCYGGGVHTVEPYEQLSLRYPVMVTALTDAPTFAFGLFEGTKLPPYDAHFKLYPTDVQKGKGLLPYSMQNYAAFFKRAWKGLFDIHLIQYISQFFQCNYGLCHVQKIENFPLIRYPFALVFRPVHDTMLIQLVQPVTNSNGLTSSKPLLLYVKKIKKIKIDRSVPIISMIPGPADHEISELIAVQLPFSKLLMEAFLFLDDVQPYKNFMLKKVWCKNDLIPATKSNVFDRVMVISQPELFPRWIKQVCKAVIFFQCQGIWYGAVVQDQKIEELMPLDVDQIETVVYLEQVIKASVDHDQYATVDQLLSFDSYREHKGYQAELVDACVSMKVCKK